MRYFADKRKYITNTYVMRFSDANSYNPVSLNEKKKTIKSNKMTEIVQMYQIRILLSVSRFIKASHYSNPTIKL